MDSIDIARDVTHAFQARLRVRHPQLRARLLQRADGHGGMPTWMEHYAIDPDATAAGIDAALEAEIAAEAAELMPCIDGERHTEAFTACAS
ncbi:MAG: DUF4936 family protein [Proteobacteria bacterium]|nr:DUF4936 family protein [Pseudomonadota bacterium]